MCIIICIIFQVMNSIFFSSSAKLNLDICVDFAYCFMNSIFFSTSAQFNAVWLMDESGQKSRSLALGS
jgi:hypothetical protein